MTDEESGKLEVFLYRVLTVAGFIVLVAAIIGIGSCTRNDYNRDEACLVAGGRIARIEGVSGSNNRGCFKVDANYEPVVVESYR